jgi:hypothetical protein
MNPAFGALAPGVLMMVVALIAYVWGRRATGAPARYFWIGAGLWFVAVFIKLVIALSINAVIFRFLAAHLPYAFYLAVGSFHVGFLSSLCEIGLTWLTGLRWRELGRDAGRGIAVGVGAGAFEAFLLGFGALAAAAAWLAGAPGTEAYGQQVEALNAHTPVSWLVGPTERVSAILCHAASRGLVLVGITHRKGVLMFLGFLIFTALDSLAGLAQLSGLMASISLWWFELMFAPMAIASIPAIQWLLRTYPPGKSAVEPLSELPERVIEPAS